MNGASRRPLLVAMGSFGAGKSTLVKRLARQAIALGQRPAIVVNELGASGVDESALLGEGVPVVTASGGCGCCVAREALAAALDRAAAIDGVTGILVEIAGDADASRLAGALDDASRRLGLATPRLVAVVDAQRIDRLRAAPAHADLVLLNKVDTRFDDEVEPMRAALAVRSGGARVIATVESTVDLEELGGWRRASDAGRPRQLSFAADHAAVRVEERELPEPLTRAELSLLVADPPPGTLRAKGFARMVGERGIYSIQIVGRSGALRLCHLQPEPRPRIVFLLE